MRMIANEELMAVAGGEYNENGSTFNTTDVTFNGFDGNGNAISGNYGSGDYNPIIIAAIIAALGAIGAATINAFKSTDVPLPPNQKATVTASTCEQDVNTGDTYCEVKTVVVTETVYTK